MSNTGLLNSNKLLSYDYPYNKIIINPSKYETNLQILINLISTKGVSPISFSLYYNTFQYSYNHFFGYGIKPSIYQEITISNNSVTTVTTYDGVVHGVINNIVPDLGYTIEVNNNEYYLKDPNNNTYIYNPSTSLRYPYQINFSNGSKWYITISNNKITKISNNNVVNAHQSYLVFSYNNENLIQYIKEYKYRVNPELLATYNFSFVDGSLVKITKEVNNYELFELRYTLTNSRITFYENINHNYFDSYFTNNLLTQVKEAHYSGNVILDNEHITSFIHNNTYTKIIYYNNKYEKLFYNSSHKIDYIVDNLGRVKKTFYNSVDDLENSFYINTNYSYANNIINNGYFTYTPLSNYFVTTGNVSIIDNDTSRDLNNILSLNYIKMDNSNNPSSISQTIEKRGSELDEFIFSFWYKVDAINSQENNIFVTFTYYYENTIVYTNVINIEIDGVDDNWRTAVYNVTPNVNFDKIELLFEAESHGLVVLVDALLLTNNENSSDISYLEKAKPIKSKRNNKEVNYIYDENMRVVKVIDEVGNIKSYSYDTNNNINQVSSSGCICSLTYDSTPFSSTNLLSKTLTLESGVYQTSSYSYNYTDDGVHHYEDYLSSKNDENNDTINYNYDLLIEEVSKATLCNKTIIEKAFDDYQNISEIIRKEQNTTNESSLSYEYHDNRLLKKVLNDNITYEFSYSLDRLTDIKINSANIEKISYTNSFDNRLPTKKEFYNDEYLHFNYDSIGNLESIYYEDPQGDNHRLLYIQYNYDFNRPFKVSLYDNGVLNNEIEYSYDEYGRVIYETHINENNKKYVYDDGLSFYSRYYLSREIYVGQIKSRTLKNSISKSSLKECVLYQDSNNPSYHALFENDNKLKYIGIESNEEHDRSLIVGYNYTRSIDSYGNNCLLLDNNKYIKYELISGTSGMISFYFLPVSISTDKYICRITNEYEFNYYYLKVITENNNNYLALFSSSSINPIKTFNEVITTSNYYVSFSYKKSGNYTYLIVTVNNEQYVISNINYNFKYFYIKQENNGLQMVLYYIQNTASFKNSCEVYKDYHFISDYLNHKVIDTSDIDITGISGSFRYEGDTLETLTDFIPLENSFKTKNNKKPVYASKEYGDIALRDKHFIYLDNEKNVFYHSNINKLIYDLDINSSGTIAFNTIINRTFYKSYLFELRDTSSRCFGLFVHNGVFYLNKNGSLQNTNITCTLNTLTFIGFTYSYNSNTGIYSLKLKINDTVLSYTKSMNELSNPYLIIGSRYLSDSIEHGIDAYYSSICYKNSVLSSSNLSLLKEEIIPITSISKIDGFSHTKKKLLCNSSDIIEKELVYKETQDRVYNEIVSENITTSNNTNIDISYDWGALNTVARGNITNVYNNSTLYRSYSYNYKGYLTEEKIHNEGYLISYSYDTNGNISNITKRQITTGIIVDTKNFSYSLSNCDILTQVDNKTIRYDVTGRYPISYGIHNGNVLISGTSYTWKRRNLVRVVDNINNYDVKFKYNGLNQRIEKEIGNTHHYYYYDGDLLVNEIVGNNVLSYYYDDNDLIGFSVKINGVKTNYYYIKDILGIITNIINDDGEIIVSYEYDSYGNILYVNDTSGINISNLNPFVYKSYYYDSEIGLYYLKSRYYNPSWCRFISPDSMSYLETDDPDRVNLYMYCGNNPVMYSDPNGNIPKWAAWVISGVLIVGGIALTILGGGILGGILIEMGVLSLVGGYLNEAAGGSFDAGYFGGMITGAIAGFFAGLGGIAFGAAFESVNMACLGYFFTGIGLSFLGGFVGNIAGELYIYWNDSGNQIAGFNWEDAIISSTYVGLLNIIAGLFSATNSSLAAVGKDAIDINEKAAALITCGTIACGVEVTCNIISYVIKRIRELFE